MCAPKSNDGVSTTHLRAEPAHVKLTGFNGQTGGVWLTLNGQNDGF